MSLLGVSFVSSRSRNGAPWDGICFAPGELPGGWVPEREWRKQDLAAIERGIEAVRRKVNQLTQSTLRGHPRGALGIADEVNKLARCVLPDEEHGGFLRLAAPGASVVLDADDVCAAIPWELLEETYRRCTKDRTHWRRINEIGDHCSQCGASMETVRVAMGIDRTISHFVRPSEAPVQEGTRVLMVLDPTSELLSLERAGSEQEETQTKRARELHDRMRRLFEASYGAGQVEVLTGQGGNATKQDVLAQLGRRDLAVIYFFGHGDADADEGWLQLSDGKVWANEIRAARPCAPLIFLNACWGAHSQPWNPRVRFQSVAHALAQGPRKSVVASLWPIEMVQASEAALGFFDHMIEKHASVADALRVVRQASLTRYDAGAADLAWMSYRLLGLVVVPQPGAQGPSLLRADGRLSIDAFAFNPEVFSRAVKRRNLQGRQRMTVEDLIAGLVRRGDLTRYVCRRANVSPDRLYHWLEVHAVEADDPIPVPPATTGSALASVVAYGDPDRWQMPSRNEIEPRLLSILEVAFARRRPVSECQMLKALMQVQGDRLRWATAAADLLPDVVLARTCLEKDVGTVVDDDGGVLLGGLDAAARKVVDTAHEFAQQRGLTPIDETLVFAAFLKQPKGFVVRAWPKVLGAAEDFRSKLVNALETGTPTSYRLNYEVCARVVLPMVQRAQELARAQQLELADDRLLLLGFAAVASSKWKALLKTQFLVDIDQLVTLEAPSMPPEPAAEDATAQRAGAVALDRHAFDADAGRVVDDAMKLARRQGSDEVRSPHLFAALLGDGTSWLAAELRKQGFAPAAVKIRALDKVRSRPVEEAGQSAASFSDHVLRILEAARAEATAKGRALAGEPDLVAAFLRDLRAEPKRGGILGQLLEELGVEAWR